MELDVNKIKAIFVDIDNTLYYHYPNARFDVRSIKALNKVREKGIKVFICTARPNYSIRDINAFERLNFDGFIASNGAIRVVDGHWITKYTFPHDILVKILEVVKKNQLCLEMVTFDNRFYATPKNELVDLHHQEFFEKDANEETFTNQEVISLLLFSPRQLDAKLKNELPKEVEYIRFGNYGVDLVVHNHHKGEGIQAVKEYLNLKQEECMAFGDDYQDIKMFEEVGFPIALGNAKDKVKAAAYAVTKKVSQHGVSCYLKKIKLVKGFGPFIW